MPLRILLLTMEILYHWFARDKAGRVRPDKTTLITVKTMHLAVHFGIAATNHLGLGHISQQTTHDFYLLKYHCGLRKRSIAIQAALGSSIFAPFSISISRMVIMA